MLKKWVYLVGNRQWFLTQEFGTVACWQVNGADTARGANRIPYWQCFQRCVCDSWSLLGGRGRGKVGHWRPGGDGYDGGGESWGLGGDECDDGGERRGAQVSGRKLMSNTVGRMQALKLQSPAWL